MLKRESRVEGEIREHIKKQKGLFYKFTSPGNAGVPDRIIVMQGKPTFFLEVKRPGGQPEPLQLWQHKQIREAGGIVMVADSLESFIEQLSWL